MTRNRRFGIGACILVAAVGYLMYAGIQQSSKYYFTVEEFLPRKARFAGEGVRIAGKVAAGSLWQKTSSKGTEMKFSIGDFTDGTAGATVETLPVEFTGVVPDMFAEGRDVIIEGTYTDGILHAQTVMTSCPSKYEAEEEGAPADGGQRAASSY